MSVYKSYDVASIAEKIRNLLGAKMLEDIPEADWQRIDSFADYTANLHGIGMEGTHRGVLKEREFLPLLEHYYASLKAFIAESQVLDPEQLHGGYATFDDVGANVKSMLGEEVVLQVPMEDWDQFEDFAAYLVELHKLAEQNVVGVEIEAYQNRLREYDAHMRMFLRQVSLFTERKAPTMFDLFAECAHVSAYYMLFHSAKTLLLFLEMLKAFVKRNHGKLVRLPVHLFPTSTTPSLYGFLFFQANLMLLFIVMTKVYYSFVKGDDINMEALGMQEQFQRFIYND